ncbi:hypothetical protein FACS1894166_09160 [Bacilli bacterium]|nr:hypothetical protein FACS1894166_09160 [Bacilli bacterium]
MTKAEIKKQLVGKGGMMAYLGTSDMKNIAEKALAGNQQCDFYTQAMAYQVAKEIGSLYFIAKGKIDQLLITGGVTYNKLFMKYLQSYLDGIIKYTVFPGEDEMLALAQGVLRVINNEEKPQTY